MISRIRKLWGILRQATGDDAYERYLTHWRSHHTDSPDGECRPLNRRAFQASEVSRRWSGIKRCC